MATVRSRIKDLLVIIGMIGVVGGVSHFVITNPLGPSRIAYQIQAPLIQLTTECSDGAPFWMGELQGYATRNQGAPASQLAYVQPNGQLHHCETGWKDGIWGQVRLKPDTRFRFASVTKTFTAAVVIDLVNQRKLAMDDAIVELLGIKTPLKDPRVADITIEDLLSHRGGWDREKTQDSMFLLQKDKSPWCPGDPEKLADSSLIYTPGQRESYSNLGYCLLGLAIERVTGQPYRDYIRDKFGLDHSTLGFIEGPYLPDEVTYDMRNENFYGSDYHEYFDFESGASAAGLSGSAIDVAQKIYQKLQARPLSILSGNSRGDCRTDAFRACYGYGVYRYQPGPEEMSVFMHGGRLPGSAAVLVVDQYGGVMVWLGAGSPKPGSDAQEQFYRYIYRLLNNSYKES